MDLSGILIIHILLLQLGYDGMPCKVKFWIDNKETLRCITTEKADDVRLKSYGMRDYGYMTSMHELRDCLLTGVKCIFHRVKGHQNGIVKYLPFEAQLNYTGDHLANRIQQCHYGPINKYLPYQTEGFILCDKNKIKIHDIEPYIRFRINGDDLSQYLMDWNKWTMTDIRKIEWDGLTRALDRLTTHSRFSHLQMIYNWRNIEM